jgi:putative FmdB family regulatory protein
MPRYNFKCGDCSKETTISMKISELKEFSGTCSECKGTLIQVVSGFNASVSVTPEERSRRIKEEAGKIADKVRAGDLNAISQVYGEK